MRLRQRWGGGGGGLGARGGLGLSTGTSAERQRTIRCCWSSATRRRWNVTRCRDPHAGLRPAFTVNNQQKKESVSPPPPPQGHCLKGKGGGGGSGQFQSGCRAAAGDVKVVGGGGYWRLEMRWRPVLGFAKAFGAREWV